MKTWLFYLVKELAEGRKPVLILAQGDNGAKAVVFDERGGILAGQLGSSEIEVAVAKKAALLKAGEACLINIEGRDVIIERIEGPIALSFWQEALAAQKEAWAAWLLTMTQEFDGVIKIVRHILAANGPFTPLRLPADKSSWVILPLNSGLGRLIIFGDDELALETAALGARAGLKVTLVTVDPLELDLRTAQGVGDFHLAHVDSWSSLNAETLSAIGLKPGVMILVTTAENEGFLETIKNSQTGWLGLAGAAAVALPESGLFPQAVSSAQRALGLIAAMLEHR
ncbi:MAG: hypothetical protein LBV23_05915 [Deltaproteobacteria bacterium]|jgi:hypothetical protein|nr:hypothetical protein [Deltaproteobacteria bacterium]